MALIAAPAEREPWRLQEAMNAPRWLEVSVDNRLRFEALSESFRSQDGEAEVALFNRLLIGAGIRVDDFTLRTEILDSRGHFFTDLETSVFLENRFDLLSLRVDGVFRGVFEPDDRLLMRLGRITIDVSSRRFVARNRFRNTINAFSGIDLAWRGRQRAAQLFLVVPVERRVTSLDEEGWSTLFAGARFELLELLEGLSTELSVFGLAELDRSRAVRRELLTPVMAVRRRPSGPGLDFEAQLAVQVGRRRRTSEPTDGVSEWFGHVEVGYSFGPARCSAAYDEASEGFDTLFGARRFDFGPTGIYGLLGRQDLRSPKALCSVQIGPVRAMAAYRAAWRQNGGLLVHQFEQRVEWPLLSGALRLEGGAAQAALGEGAPRPSATPVYGYVQTSVHL